MAMKSTALPHRKKKKKEKKKKEKSLETLGSHFMSYCTGMAES
jgi:hypothetical protein